MAQVIGVRNTSGDGSAVIAAPGAGQRIVITYWRAQAEADGDQTMLLKSGSTVIGRFFCATKAQGIIENLSLVQRGNGGDSAIYCGANEAIYVNLSASAEMNYTIRYYIDPA